MGRLLRRIGRWTLIDEMASRQDSMRLLGLVVTVPRLRGLQSPVDLVDRPPAPRNLAMLDSIQGSNAKTGTLCEFGLRPAKFATIAEDAPRDDDFHCFDGIVAVLIWFRQSRFPDVGNLRKAFVFLYGQHYHPFPFNLDISRFNLHRCPFDGRSCQRTRACRRLEIVLDNRPCVFDTIPPNCRRARPPRSPSATLPGAEPLSK